MVGLQLERGIFHHYMHKKSAVTKHARRLGFEFEWQARFHDRIIRDDAEFQRIARYIENNVSNWESDTFR